MNVKVRRKSAIKAMFLQGSTHMILVLLVVFTHGTAGAQVDETIVAPEGCAMAHCDQSLADNVHLSPPLSLAESSIWHDTGVNGSSIGLGCVSNGDIVVCSFRSSSSKPVEIKAYDSDGNRLWDYRGLRSNAFYSAPMIGIDGDVVAADSSTIIRFDSEGFPVWSRATAGGTPISPNVTDDAKIVLATQFGPISAYDYGTGTLMAQTRLNATLRVSGRWQRGYFDTINTPAVRGSRIYISTRFTYLYRSTNIGRLYALDLGDNGFSIAWYFEFQAPSGTSPTLGNVELGGTQYTAVYFDGAGFTPSSARAPQAFAVVDKGGYGELLWSYPMPTVPQSSPAIDPRGGIWYYAPGYSDLIRIDRVTGQLIESFDLTDIVAETGTYIPVSVMTLTGEETAPVMIVSASTSSFSRTYVTAIDLKEHANALRWKYRVDQGKRFSGVPSGQYTLVNPNDPVVVFSTNANGVWGLAAGASAP